MKKIYTVIAIITLSLASTLVLAQEEQEPMTFFVTSTGVGDGANLGGLAGADAHCQSLAQAAGAGGRTWRAYLSTQGSGAVNARDRIGTGPWHNAEGVRIARNVAELHGDIERDRNYIFKGSAIDENGNVINGRGDRPNRHDILTGSNSLGLAILGDDDRTCGNWTSNDEGRAIVGHHDRNGGGNTSWNSVHPSRGCSQEDLVGTGGNGLFYCFAAR
ncbi:MAG: hypothetical protein HKN08_00705 [Gammaproteobacteria bacterium]|nr:hypothetical protein [Gammaproteobacteria bacterium]